MDPNLLPQNLRSKEAKELERQKKQPRGFRVDLHSPQAERAGFDLANSDRPTLNWWQKLTGTSKPTPSASPTLTDPAVDDNQYPHMNWLASDTHRELPKRKQKTEYKITKQPKIKSASGGSWFNKLLGQPISPIISTTETRQTEPKQVMPKPIRSNTPDIKPIMPVIEKKPLPVESKFQSQSTSVISTKELKKKQTTNDSWWSILKGLLGFSKVKEEKLKFASLTKPKESTAVQPKAVEVKPVKESAHEKPKESPKKVIRPAYNLVPKHERAEINVNLIPQELTTKSQLGSFISTQSVVIAIIVPIILITAAYFSLIYLQQNLEKAMTLNKNDLTELNRQIGDFVVKEKLNNRIAQKVTTIKSLMDEKIIWSNFFEMLEKYTLDGVYFTSLTADTSGILILPGIADNYTVLAQQLAVFRDASEFVKEVKISNAQLYSESKAGVLGSSFQIRLVLQDRIFKKAK